MKKKLELKSALALQKFQNFIPKESDAGKYDEIKVVDFFHYFRMEKSVLHIAYHEVLAKLCYVCSNRLILRVEVDYRKPSTDREERWGSYPQVVNNKAVIDPKRFAHYLQLLCFDIQVRQKIDKDLEVFETRRMPKVVWDGKSLLSDYPSNTVVECPLFGVPYFNEKIHSGLEKDKYKTRYTDPEKYGPINKRSNIVWWGRVDWLINNFKPWLWEPIMFTKEPPAFYNGSHRFVVARETGMKTIDVRIVEKRVREDDRFRHPLF